MLVIASLLAAAVAQRRGHMDARIVLACMRATCMQTTLAAISLLSFLPSAGNTLVAVAEILSEPCLANITACHSPPSGGRY